MARDRTRILILDSPTVGVDVGAKVGIYQIVDALAARGIAIILISDEVEEVVPRPRHPRDVVRADHRDI